MFWDAYPDGVPHRVPVWFQGRLGTIAWGAKDSVDLFYLLSLSRMGRNVNSPLLGYLLFLGSYTPGTDLLFPPGPSSIFSSWQSLVFDVCASTIHLHRDGELRLNKGLDWHHRVNGFKLKD